MGARVDDEKRIVLDDPAASGPHPGDTGEVVFTKMDSHGQRRRIRGLWKGTHTSAEAIDQIRREMHAAVTDNG